MAHRTIAVSTAVLFLTFVGLSTRAEVLRPPPGVQVEDLVSLFDRIAAKREYSAREGIVKWLRPIRYAVLGSPSADFSSRVDEHFRLVTELTGLPATKVPPIARPANAGSDANGEHLVFDRSRSQLILNMALGGRAHDNDAIVTFGYVPDVYVWRANFIVFVAAEADIKGFLSVALPGAAPEVRDQLRNGTSPCASTVTHVSGQDEVAVAVAIVRHDVSDWLVGRCIAEELTQPLGLLNDARGSRLTLFDDDFSQRKSHLTDVDMLFLSILYNDDVRPGMRGDALAKIVRRLLRDRVEPTGRIGG